MTMKFIIIYTCTLLLINSVLVDCDGVVPVLVHGLFASPVFFKEQNWKFDPDVSARRSIEFQEQNGYRSEKLIERFGLGKDGKMAERQYLNEARDRESLQIIN